MGSSSKTNPLQMLQLDIQYRDRQLAAELAMHNAEMAYQQKRLEMVDLPGLEQDKQQFAMQYALEQAKLTWEQEISKMEFGETQRQFDIQNSINQRKLQLDENAQAFDQMIRTGQMQLDEASVTGFYQGNPTMQRIQMEAGLTGYYNGSPTFEREKFNEQNREFDLNFGLNQAQTYLNAPRGPADYNAYINRLTGMHNAGWNLPGAINNLFQGAQVGTTGAMQGPMPMSNTEFAGSLIYGPYSPQAVWGHTTGPEGAGSPSQAPALPGVVGAPGTTPTGQPPSATNPLYANQALKPGGGGTPAQGTPDDPLSYAGQNPMFSAAAGGSAGGIGSPAFTAGTPQIRSGSNINYRDWEKLSPVTQQYATGYAEEELGQPKEDFLWGIAQGAPALQSSPTAKQGVF